MSNEMRNEITQMINAVISTLDGVEVKGRQNMYSLFGAMGVLEQVIQKLSDEQHPAVEPGADGKVRGTD